jgi:hypothetical protein
VRSIELIPNNRADETEDVAGRGCHNDESNTGSGIKWLNHINRLDHVRPEDEIDDGLRPTQQHETRPNQMPPSDDGGKDQANFVRISRPFYAALLLGLPVARCWRNSLGDWPKTRLNMRLNCVSD